MALATLVGGKLYRMGMSGDVVRQAQLALGKLGYPLSGTGYFGPATDTAVSAFQKKAGLKADGVIGPATASAIDAAAMGKVPLVTKAPRTEIARPLWLQAGLGFIGVHEGRDDQEIIGWAKEEGGEIANDYRDTKTAWCALGIGHCLTCASLKGTGTLWALDYAGKWPSVKLAGPAPGAIAPMHRPGGGHVAMVVGRDQHGRLMMLGFNQSDACSIEPFPAARPVGFWWPAGVPLPSPIGFDSLPVVLSDGKVSTRES